MPIQGVKQPEFIVIDESLRLRKYDGIHNFAFDWYQDPDTVLMVDGVKNTYSRERLDKMYAYLDNIGELYFIECLENDAFIPIGDVAFWKDDMPIVIGLPEYRNRGIGRRVAAALMDRARTLGFPEFHVGEIYRWNMPSRALFTSMGFEPYEETEQGYRYKLQLTSSEV